MISFANIMREVLTERMTFKALKAVSDPARQKRADHDVHARSVKVMSVEDQEAWKFSYKSNPSTTKERHTGIITFFKENISPDDRVDDLECMVDCSCPDYRYRWAYQNNKQDAGPIGNNSLNKNNGAAPKRYVGFGNGLCKHLLALSRFLETYVDSDAPTEKDKPEPPAAKAPEIKPKIVKPPISPSKKPPTIDAPKPEDSYSDSRSGDDIDGDSYSDSRSGLSENVQHISNKLSELVRTTPVFDVYYSDAEDKSVNEDYHVHHKEYRMYEGSDKITAVFDDNSHLCFEIHFRSARGVDKEKWRHKALTTWKSVANELYRDVPLSDALNPIQKSWKQCFSEALSDPRLKEYIRDNHHQRVFGNPQ